MPHFLDEIGQGLWPAFMQCPIITAGSTVARREPSPAAWSPNGKFVAFYWSRDGIVSLWIVPAQKGRPVRLTGDEWKISAEMNTLYDRRLSARPAWSPDNRKIAFTAKYQNEDEMSLWIVSLDGGLPQRLTKHVGSDRTPVWSPDGKWIAYVCLRDNIDDIWIVSTESGSPLQITYDRYNNVDPQWAPSGKKLAYSSQRSEDLFCQDICTVDLTNGQYKVLTTDENVSDRYPRWSPNETRIFFISDRNGYDEVWVMDQEGKNACQVTPTTGQDKGEFSISHDGKWLAYESSLRCNIDIKVVSTNGGKPVWSTSGDGLNTVPEWSPDGDSILYLHGDAKKSSDLWISKFRGTESTQLTDTMIGFFDAEILIDPEQIYFPGYDDESIDGLLYHPSVIHKGDSLPAILLIHGGPNAQHFNIWWPYLQYLVQKGYVIIAPNCHGSMGYGRKFMDSNLKDWAGKDKVDWIKAVEYLKSLGYIDGKRIGIWGRSYGGYATCIGMSHLPEIFRAGICHFGPTDLVTFWDQTSVRYLSKRMMGLPFMSMDLHKERSAVPFASNVIGPILFLHGSEDHGVPSSQSEEMIAALEKAGKEYEYKCYEGEGHGFLQPEHVFDAAHRIEAFWDKNLKGSSS